jgi:hypothetical protein
VPRLSSQFPCRTSGLDHCRSEADDPDRYRTTPARDALVEGTIQRQEERDPQDHDRKVETVFERATDPNSRKARGLIWIRSHKELFKRRVRRYADTGQWSHRHVDGIGAPESPVRDESILGDPSVKNAGAGFTLSLRYLRGKRAPGEVVFWRPGWHQA